MPPESPYRSTLRPEDFAPQRGFNVSIVSIIVYLAGIAVHFFMFGGKERVMIIGGPTMWMVIGGYVGILLVAMMISYFAFAGTRSRVVSAIFFCLSVPALVFGDMKINGLADAKIKPDTSKLAAAGVVGLPTPTPAPPTPKPAVAENIPGNPTYSSNQRQQYIQTASDAFVTSRDAKIKAFQDAFAALQTAGGVAAKGLTSKEAIAERRKLVATLNTANDDYITFLTNLEATYRAELQKTPLVPNDVDNTVNMFVAKNADIADRLAARAAEKNLLKATDDVLAAMDRMYGRWKLQGDKAVFQKKADVNEYASVIEKFNAAANAQAASIKKLHVEGGSSAPGATPDASAPTPAGSSLANDAAPAAAGKTPVPVPSGSPSASLSTPSSSVGAVVTPAGTPASAASPTP